MPATAQSTDSSHGNADMTYIGVEPKGHSSLIQAWGRRLLAVAALKFLILNTHCPLNINAEWMDLIKA